MKKIILLSYTVCMLTISSYAQILKPVTWSYAAKKTSASTATVFIKATIDQGWHLYSQNVKEGGPVKTSFTFPQSSGYSLVGKTIEPKAIIKFEPTFKMEVSYFEKSVVFRQNIRLKGKTASVKGTVEFMVCDDKQCLPPEQIEFMIPVK